ncbi:GNAT family acetyltransferase [Sphingomonas sp. CL5.1]|uniref:GNAT family acetyltransferase n=1 Tax=Sphingomonas sp. CL5.1 TaxID=2653203 RepID=UPI001582958F|nr:GNAT family acetyltransferase [Sphingomonas sp. CL5.1]QKR98566.1 GNAT family acetyltransferase [Sphingomonas sp. CL5.1]
MIAEASLADEAELVVLWEVCGLTRPWNPPARDIARALGGPASTILVARREGAVTGSVMVGHDGHRGWVYYLAVAPDARRTGLGRALMQAAEAWLRERGAPKLQLMVRAGNEEVLAFYRALGFVDQPVAVLGRFLD